MRLLLESPVCIELLKARPALSATQRLCTLMLSVLCVMPCDDMGPFLVIRACMLWQCERIPMSPAAKAQGSPVSLLDPAGSLCRFPSLTLS